MNSSRFLLRDLVRVLPQLILDEVGFIEAAGALRSYNQDLVELSFEVPFYIQEVEEVDDLLDIKFWQEWPEFEGSCGDRWDYRMLVSIAHVERLLITFPKL